MRPRTIIAVQFALWELFFSGLIPFAGEFLMPIVWIYDRRVFAGLLFINLVQIGAYLPVAFGVIPAKTLSQIPTWEMPLLGPLALIVVAGNFVFTTNLGAWYVRRNIRKKAPDIQRVLQ